MYTINPGQEELDPAIEEFHAAKKALEHAQNTLETDHGAEENFVSAINHRRALNRFDRANFAYQKLIDSQVKADKSADTNKAEKSTV